MRFVSMILKNHKCKLIIYTKYDKKIYEDVRALFFSKKKNLK
jgi:hypothetical protein